MKQETEASVGRQLARRVFQARGNHTEAHLSEYELATLLGLAYGLGMRAAEKHAAK